MDYAGFFSKLGEFILCKWVFSQDAAFIHRRRYICTAGRISSEWNKSLYTVE